MKKVFVFLIILLLPLSINASNKQVVSLDKCIDGDTAWVYLDNESIKLRFLAIDTPESTNKKEAYGKKASNFTCNLLTNASKIEIEYDENSDKFDKYNRHLVWIFVDDELLQDLIVKNGLAEIKYVYGNYKYLDILKESEELAKSNNLNIWSNNAYLFEIFGYKITNEILYNFILIIIILILCIFNKKIRNKVKSKIKRKISKKIDDIF